MNIAFWDNQLCERGTSTSLFDYAFYNQKILKNRSYIFYLKNNRSNVEEVINKFNDHFDIFPVDNFNDVDNILKQNNITHIYIIKSGNEKHLQSKVAKNCIHCVFHTNSPHGDVYSSIHEMVPGNEGGKKYPVIPHMINLPDCKENMRKELNIPDDAIVFGGYGGSNNFSIHYVQKLVEEIAEKNKNIYFLFANFKPFCESKINIIHLPKIINLEKKTKFINTCDANLWARQDGETFGLAIGEFCSKNKPVICTEVNIKHIGHKYILKDKAIWYTDKEDLKQILLNFDPKVECNKDWNAYSEYTPQKVMKIFDKIFLSK